MDFLLSVIYSKSESAEKMAYSLIFDLIEGKIVPGHLSQSSDNQLARKRPESSSPEKLKARNKDKFDSQQVTGNEPQKKVETQK